MAAPKHPKEVKPDHLTEPPDTEDDSQEINSLDQAIVIPDKDPSEWTKEDWEAYYASLPPTRRIMSDEEIAEDNEREARGEYLDIDRYLEMSPDEASAYIDSLLKSSETKNGKS